MKTTIQTALSLLILAALMTGCGSSESAATAKAGQSGAVAQVQATSEDNVVTATSSARDIDGVRHQMSEWVGRQPVVINFWGTWCPPCRREIPDLVRLYGEYNSQGVEIVSLAVRDTPTKVRQYAGRAGMNWVMLTYDDSVAKEFKLGGSVPTTIFFDKHGNEQARFVGARDYSTFKAAFDKIISDS